MKSLRNLYVKLFSRPALYRFNRIMYILSLKGMGITNYQGELSGEKNLLKRLRKENLKVFFDVGANIGDYSKEVKEFFPNAKIYSFEPVKGTFETLKKRVDAHVYNFGLGKKEETLTIFYGDEKNSPHSSLFEEVEKKHKKKKILSEKVKIRKLDNFIKENKIKKIDFLKIDVEGNEFSVLKGAKMALKEKRIRYIQFEFNEMNLVSKASFRDFKNILPDYDFYRILPNSILKLNSESNLDTEIFLFQNILAVPR